MSGISFRFSLKPVLELQEHEVDKIQEKLGLALRRKRRQMAVIAEVEEKMSGSTQNRKNGRHQVSALRQRERFRAAQHNHLRKEKEKLDAINRQIKNLRREVQEKRAKQKSLESLRDREKKVHDREVKQWEAKQLDEQSILRHHQPSMLS